MHTYDWYDFRVLFLESYQLANITFLFMNLTCASISVSFKLNIFKLNIIFIAAMHSQNAFKLFKCVYRHEFDIC
jgi:hypothetical protein